MSTFSEFSKNTKPVDMNRPLGKKKSKASQSSNVEKERIDPNPGNEREYRDDGMERERLSRSLQGNSNPNTRSNSERSQYGREL